MNTLFATSLALAAVGLLGAAAPPPLPAKAGGLPEYDAAGRMLMPADYRDWVFLSSGLNMSYSSDAAIAGQDVFGNTFVPRAAYEAFKKTGVWPNKTVIFLENRGGSSKGSINKAGKFQTTDYFGGEAHVKDSRFAGGWAFFGFNPAGETAKEIPHTAACYSCHEQHAAADTTFVQFYPTLLPVATKLGTLNKSYLAEGGLAPIK